MVALGTATSVLSVVRGDNILLVGNNLGLILIEKTIGSPLGVGVIL